MTPALILAALTTTAPTPAITPEPSCAPNIAAMIAQLAEHYGERVTGGGVEISGGGVLLFARPDGKSWAIVYFEGRTTPACIVGAGTGWVEAPAGEGL